MHMGVPIYVHFDVNTDEAKLVGFAYYVPVHTYMYTKLSITS